MDKRKELLEKKFNDVKELLITEIKKIKDVNQLKEFIAQSFIVMLEADIESFKFCKKMRDIENKIDEKLKEGK